MHGAILIQYNFLDFLLHFVVVRSNVLQNLISRIYGRLEEIEWFVHSLASVGKLNLLALIKDQAGSRVIQKCLETFSPEHNLVRAHPNPLSR
jgi:hypothetical protein